jgi:predicted DNA-binding protein
MKTLHIRIDEERWERLQRVAQERAVTPEQLAAEAIEAILEPLNRRERYKQAMQVVGKYRSGRSNISECHDAYLTEAYIQSDTASDEGIR